MPKKKKEIAKRQKVFNFISNVIDAVQEKWRTYVLFSLGVTMFGWLGYIAFYWIDTVKSVDLVINYL
tara:strand:+ start:2687 stop:2887 length:201 start_codon:yes stop_codon:yes gene_type:complete